MLKIIKIISLFVFVYIVWFVLFPRAVSAQCAGDCICVANGGETGGSCDPSFNNCDNGGSCSCTNWGQDCNGATPPPGGGGGLGCSNNNVDCPQGSTIDLNQPISTRCKNLDQSDRMCEPVGSAQRQTDCCKYNDDTCTNPQYTTYSCCPAGTTSTSIEGGTYERYNSCFAPTTCNDSNDIYVSHYNSPVAGTCACNCSDDRGCGANCDKREGSWVYNAVTTCRTVTYSCVSNCDTTAPSGISYTSSNQTLTWTAGSNGTSQRLYVSSTQSDVTNDCGAGTNCVVSNSNATSPTTLPSLTEQLLIM